MNQPMRAAILLNTRPEPMGEALGQLFQSEGLDSLNAPIIDTVPTPINSLPVSVAELINRSKTPDLLWIFVSRTAVRHFVTLMNQQSTAFQPEGTVIAVGPGSRDELVQAYPNLVDKVHCPVESNSEALVKLEPLNTKAPQAILVKGAGGRDVIKTHITRLNGDVVELDLYERQMISYSKSAVISWLQCDYFLATSVAIADGIISNCEQQLSQTQFKDLQNHKKWLVISERIYQHLVELGIDEHLIRVTDKTDNLSILQHLNQWQGEHSMTKDNNPEQNADKIKSSSNTLESAAGKSDQSASQTKRKSKESDDALKKLEQEIRQSANKAKKPTSEQTVKANDAQNKATDKTSAPKSPDVKTSAAKASESTKDRAKTTKPQPHNKLSKTAVFALLFSFVAIGAVAFVWWQSQMWLKTQTQIETLNQQAVNNNLNELKTLQTELMQTNARLNEQLAQNKNTTKAVNTLSKRVKELGQAQPNEWLASEALYLVSLAERKLTIDQDVDTALMLLANANNRLAAMNDPTVFPLRQEISEDVAKLHGITQPDRDSIYLSLSGILDQVATLPFSHFYIPKQSTPAAEKEVSNELNDWQSNLTTSFERFMSNFVTIKHRDIDIEPQIPVQQQWFIRANITRQLLMAQQNVLQQNNALYSDAVVRSIHWMQQYFDLANPQVVATINTLSELQNRNVELSLPAKLNSQSVLANFVMRQQARIDSQ